MNIFNRTKGHKLKRIYYSFLRWFIDKTFPAIPYFYKKFPHEQFIDDSDIDWKIKELLARGSIALEKWEVKK
jgi:ABC-type uncharacterized transport system permease subunit